MYNRWLLPIIFFILSPILWADTPAVIRRVCISGANNELFFTPTDNTCSLSFQYKIWGRIGSVGPFSLIDSILTKAANQYTHIDANLGGTKNWQYFIVVIDSCGPIYETFSDTISIDKTPPDFVYIDSVSIDPITNIAHIGWSGNKSPDFSYFKLYSITNLNTPIPPFKKDSFFIETRAGYIPVNDSLRYDLSSVDSCGLETTFERNQHVSMYLRVIPDTCNYKNNLQWTPYIGWTVLKRYYIYKKIQAGPYLLIDSVGSNQLSYTDTMTLGLQYGYFIRAVKDTTISISSSSNGVVISSRFRIEPTQSYISSVSVVKPGDPVIKINIYNPQQEVRLFQLWSKENLTDPFSFVDNIQPASGAVSNYSKNIPFSISHKYIQVFAVNACSTVFPSTNISKYTTLSSIGEDKQNTLYWDKYSTWNMGVNKYLIHRGTNNSIGTIEYNVIDSVVGTDSFYIDKNIPAIVGEDGFCYFVEAIQNAGDSNNTIESSFSTTSCILGVPTVYIPSAFRPEGYNKIFRPEGSFIDYTNSKMDIYDRWGQKLLSISNIRNGWDGKDQGGIPCIQGVYYYRLFIKSTNGSEKTYTGLVTLLN